MNAPSETAAVTGKALFNAVNRFRDALVAAPTSAEPAVLCGYLQGHIEDLRRSFALLAQPETYAECKTLCADLLHPFVKESPFLRRALEKPLGYAGDFE